jgi:hypothetical protein
VDENIFFGKSRTEKNLTETNRRIKMRNSLRKGLISTLSVLTMLSMNLMPAYQPSEDCERPYCENECNETCSNTTWIVLGAVAIGAGAGAIAGAAFNNNHHHHHHNQGTNGNSEESFPDCRRDEGQTLTFTATIDTTNHVAVGSYSVIPVITLPDQTVIQGNPVTVLLNTINVIPYPKIIHNPEFGNYVVGFLVNQETIPVNSNPFISVTSSRSGTTTNVFLNGEDEGQESLISGSEILTVFTYNIHELP